MNPKLSSQGSNGMFFIVCLVYRSWLRQRDFLRNYKSNYLYTFEPMAVTELYNHFKDGTIFHGGDYNPLHSSSQLYINIAYQIELHHIFTVYTFQLLKLYVRYTGRKMSFAFI